MSRCGSTLARVLTVLFVILFVGAIAPGSFAQTDDTAVSNATPEVIDSPSQEPTAEATAEPTSEATEEVTPESTEPTVEPVSTEESDPSTPEPVTAETTPESAVSESGVDDFFLYVVDLDGNPITGTCWDLYFQTASAPFESYCDVDDGTDDGTVTVPLSDFPSDAYYHFGSNQPPAGYPTCGKFCSTTFWPLRSDDSITVELVPFANVTLYKVDENGDPLPGACFELFPQVDEVCDIDDGTEDGTIFFEDVTPREPPRTYLAFETSAPAGYYLDPRGTGFEVYGVDVEIEIANAPLSETGTLTIRKVDTEGELLLGACFEVQDEEGNSFGEACDYDDDPVDFTEDGITHYPALVEGTYDLFESRTPEGYGRSYTPISVTVVRGEDVEVDFVNGLPVELTIHKIDKYGDPVEGTCFRLHAEDSIDSRTIHSRCDSADGDDNGDILFIIADDQFGPGTYWLYEDAAPNGYNLPTELIEVTLSTGENEITVVNYRTIRLSIDKFDENGQPLAGSCFTLESTDGADVSVEICDIDDGFDDGYVDFGEQPEGEYALFETQAPAGYVPIFPLSVVLQSDDVRLEVTDVLIASSATLTNEKVDESDDPLAGACFALFEGGLDPVSGEPISTVATQTVCDDDDGENDGTIAFDPVPLTDSGVVSIVETTTPAGYVTIDPIEIELELGENTITVENELAPEPTVVPTVTPDPDDDEEDVTTLPNTGAGLDPLSTGGVMLMMLAAIAIVFVAVGRAGTRRS